MDGACAREQDGKRGARGVRGGQMVMINIVSWERVTQKEEKGNGRDRNIARVEQREGCMLRLMDGWCMKVQRK